MRNTKEPLHSSLIEPVQKIRVMRKNGEGPHFIRIGKSIRYTIASLQDYILSLYNAPKVVRVEPKPIKQLAQKSIHREEITYNPLIDPNKEVAQKILLQDIFMPTISEME